MHVKKTLDKRTSNTINLLTHSIAMPNAISKIVAVDKANDFIKLLRGENPHYPHSQCADDTLIAFDKIHE